MGQGILLSGETEVDFMIHGVFSYELFGQTVWITRTHVCVLIVMLIIMAFCLFANRAIKRASEVPGAFQNVVELVVEMLDNMIGGVMGRYAVNFRNYIGTIFIFILISNISGLLGLRPPTADYGVTFALGIITFVLIHFNKFKHQKVSGVIKGLCSPWPIWAPINIISDLPCRFRCRCVCLPTFCQERQSWRLSMRCSARSPLCGPRRCTYTLTCSRERFRRTCSAC